VLLLPHYTTRKTPTLKTLMAGAATALHKVAICYAHRAEQLEGLLALTPKNSPTKKKQIGLLSASCHAPSPRHYAPAEAMTATTDTRDSEGTTIQG